MHCCDIEMAIEIPNIYHNECTRAWPEHNVMNSSQHLGGGKDYEK